MMKWLMICEHEYINLSYRMIKLKAHVATAYELRDMAEKDTISMGTCTFQQTKRGGKKRTWMICVPSSKNGT